MGALGCYVRKSELDVEDLVLRKRMLFGGECETWRPSNRLEARDY